MKPAFAALFMGTGPAGGADNFVLYENAAKKFSFAKQGGLSRAFARIAWARRPLPLRMGCVQGCA